MNIMKSVVLCDDDARSAMMPKRSPCLNRIIRVNHGMYGDHFLESCMGIIENNICNCVYITHICSFYECFISVFLNVKC